MAIAKQHPSALRELYRQNDLLESTIAYLKYRALGYIDPGLFEAKLEENDDEIG